MSLSFLIGAILGSGFFIVAGREPAERLLAVAKRKLKR